MFPGAGRAKEWVSWVVAVVTPIAGAFLAVRAIVDSYATDKEVSGEVAKHDASPAAHPALQGRLARLEENERNASEATGALGDQARRVEAALFWIYWQRAGEKGAEDEPDRRLRARAAREARARFEGYYREGLPLEEAFRRAVVVPLP